jgi:hypothetical protein
MNYPLIDEVLGYVLQPCCRYHYVLSQCLIGVKAQTSEDPQHDERMQRLPAELDRQYGFWIK